MNNKYPNDPYLSEEYCSDEDFYQHLEDEKNGKIEKPAKKPNPYLSEEYCSDEDWFNHIQSNE